MACGCNLMFDGIQAGSLQNENEPPNLNTAPRKHQRSLSSGFGSGDRRRPVQGRSGIWALLLRAMGTGMQLVSVCDVCVFSQSDLHCGRITTWTVVWREIETG